MTPEQIDRVFGRGRLKMMTGEHVEVFREAVGPGERRRYTKRFLDTGDGDFGQWTEREWRILARLIGHGIRCVPDVVQFDGGAVGGVRLVQTYDAGVTVDQWATLLPVARNGVVHRHVFEDCAHWWALAHHCLAALDEIHRLQLVHLDVKGDNICIPFGPVNFDPDARGLRFYPVFARLALIDFAFSLVSRERLANALPIGWQKDYDYQSPRLLAALEAGRDGDMEPTEALDWRCDLYSLAAMLKRYLPDEERARGCDASSGWSPERYDEARALIFRIRDAHDRDFPHWRPHQELMSVTGSRLREPDLAASLDYGWTLERDAAIDAATSASTPMTRIAPTLRTAHASPIATRIVAPTAVTVIAAARRPLARRSGRAARALVATTLALAAFAAPSQIGDPVHRVADDVRALVDTLRARLEPKAPEATLAQSSAVDAQREQAATPTSGATSDAGAPSPEPTAVSDRRDPEPDEQSTASLPASSIDSPAAPPAAARSKVAAPATRPPQTTRPQPVQRATSRAKSAVSRSPAAPMTQAHAKSLPAAQAGRSATQRAVSRPQPRATQPTQLAISPPLQLANSPLAQVPASTPPVPAEASAVIALANPEPPRVEPVPSVAASTFSPPTDSEPRTTSKLEQHAQTTPDAPPAGATAATQRDDRISESPKPPTPPRVASSPPRRDDLRSQLSALWRTLRGRDQPRAPIEERIAQAPPAAPTAPRVVAPAAAATAPSVDSLPQPTPSWTPAPRPSPPVQVLKSPGRSSEPPADELATQARRIIADSVPRVAAQAQADASRVLWIAANATHPSQEWSVVDAARARWPSESMSIGTTNVAPIYARRLQDEARHAFASGGLSAAINAQLRAFGADPRDADVAGYLAFLHLRTSPPQADTARQLALYAIALRGSRRTTRADDWQTFAIASALIGRENDARHALYVATALGRNVDRSCRSALAASATYGEPLRAPTQALLYRIHVQGRGYESPYCAWPPDWNAVSRSP